MIVCYTRCRQECQVRLILKRSVVRFSVGDMCVRCACLVSDQREHPQMRAYTYLVGGPAALSKESSYVTCGCASADYVGAVGG